ncbi:hypothetical protein HNY73_013873 [Argiope bruennichi]|uniref:Uncharacterized protein n=1 Tax=Argiope bruennichi TaxID=94029 RepID=A0A8T0ESE9_ARGBR|nr:hypothetical protein HNY73_013873 [Argiope bruennichi]
MAIRNIGAASENNEPANEKEQAERSQKVTKSVFAMQKGITSYIQHDLHEDISQWILREMGSNQQTVMAFHILHSKGTLCK